MSPWAVSLALAATHGDPNQHGGTSRKCLYGRGSGSCGRHQHKPTYKIPSHKKCRLKSHRSYRGSSWHWRHQQQLQGVTGKWEAGVLSVSSVHISACAGTRFSYRFINTYQHTHRINLQFLHRVSRQKKRRMICILKKRYPPSQPVDFPVVCKKVFVKISKSRGWVAWHNSITATRRIRCPRKKGCLKSSPSRGIFR